MVGVVLVVLLGCDFFAELIYWYVACLSCLLICLIMLDDCGLIISVAVVLGYLIVCLYCLQMLCGWFGYGDLNFVVLIVWFGCYCYDVCGLSVGCGDYCVCGCR